MNQDRRFDEYQNLAGTQLAKQVAEGRASADVVYSILLDYVQPRSILDVGCGLGVWLAAARDRGIQDLHGIEGPWMDRSKLTIDPGLVTHSDLEHGFNLNRRFDLVICLEVAEHLSPASAEKFVQASGAHGDLVLFSAAIPFQGGHHHVNEQFLDYWAGLFGRINFRPADLFRPHIWNDDRVLWWLQQNLILFAHDNALTSNEKLRQEANIRRPLSMVHPNTYMPRMQEGRLFARNYQAMTQLLGVGGTFDVTRLPDGQINVRRR